MERVDREVEEPCALAADEEPSQNTLFLAALVALGASGAGSKGDASLYVVDELNGTGLYVPKGSFDAFRRGGAAESQRGSLNIFSVRLQDLDLGHGVREGPYLELLDPRIQPHLAKLLGDHLCRLLLA